MDNFPNISSNFLICLKKLKIQEMKNKPKIQLDLN